MKKSAKISALALMLATAGAAWGQEAEVPPEQAVQSIGGPETTAQGAEVVADDDIPGLAAEIIIEPELAAESDPVSDAALAGTGAPAAEEGVETEETIAEDLAKSYDVVVAADDVAEDPQILLMPAKSEIYFITTGGSELRADWIEAAEENLFGHLQDQVAQRGMTHATFDKDAEKSEELTQLLLLADVVQASSLLTLPHKSSERQKNVLGNNTGLTLGDDVAMLKAQYGADKAIFLHNFGAIESSGVQAAKWGIAILSQGAYVPNLASLRGTYASVFDLETGELVSHQFVTFGDSRDPGEAENIVSRIMQNLDID